MRGIARSSSLGALTLVALGCVGNAPSRKAGAGAGGAGGGGVGGSGGASGFSFLAQVIGAGDSGQGHDRPRLGDVDGDGELDVVTLAGNGDNLHRFLVDAAGNVAPGVDVLTNFADTLERGYAVGHLDGDTFADFMVAQVDVGGTVDPLGVIGAGPSPVDTTIPSNLVFLESMGTDTVAGTVCAVGLGDLNEDGDDDVVVAGSDGADCTGSAGFVQVFDRTGAMFNARGVATGYLATFVEVVDAEAIGKRQDLLVGDSSGNRVVIYVGPTFTTMRAVATSGAPIAAAIGDLDGSGVLDVVSIQTGQLQVFLGDDTVGTAHALGADPVHVAILDLDADGDQDVVVGLDREIRYGLNDGAGVFGGFDTVLEAGNFTGRFVVLDTDDDGLVDKVITPNDSGGLLVLNRQP